MDREGVKDALALKTECERQKCAAGMRTFLSLRKSVPETDVNVKTGSIINLDQEVECCEIADVTKGRHLHPDVLQERHPLSESHPRIMSGKRVLPELFGSPCKRLRTEDPSTNNLNTLLNFHSDEPRVSKTSKSYLSAAGIIESIESEKNKTTTSSNIMKKESDVPHMAFDI